MAGTGVSGGDILLLQQELIGRASGKKEEDLKKESDINRGVYKIISDSNDTTTIKNELTKYMKLKVKDVPESDLPKNMTQNDIINAQISVLTTPWMLNFIRYNPAPMLGKVKCPVLAINGSKDLQVPSSVNLPAIENALKKGGNTKSTVKELPGLNHLFQECTTGLPKEYSEIEQTISPLALQTMGDWIKETIKK
jgi:hypothetical protein